jgi:hypothetical protein
MVEETLGEKILPPIPLCAPQIPHGLAWNRSRDLGNVCPATIRLSLGKGNKKRGAVVSAECTDVGPKTNRSELHTVSQLYCLPHVSAAVKSHHQGKLNKTPRKMI